MSIFNEYKNTLPYVSKKTDPVAHAAYCTNETLLLKKFYTDVKRDLGILDNPKADLLMAKAWELGHSSGYSEVYYYANDLVDLIR